ncbi:MAG: DNA polymerase III subunit epsilon [Gammaproteobacteria bacterium]|nr:DNA polymerase III subunit epsilon [Gammaproteobacteria bacterium]
MRQIILDTETTGLEPREGHRIIEIGAVELLNRNITGQDFHQYLNPEREIDADAVRVHGLTSEFLADKPTFADIAESFLEYVRGAELIIHNAAFDVGFINHELAKLGSRYGRLEDYVSGVLDTLLLARRRHPGQRNSLDALCKRYGVDNSNRELHGALLDSRILAEVYLAMTGGQSSLGLDTQEAGMLNPETLAPRRLADDRPRLKVLRANEAEMAAHQRRMEAIAKAAGGETVWGRLSESAR